MGSVNDSMDFIGREINQKVSLMRRIGCWIHKVFIPGAKNDKFPFLWYINIQIPDVF